MVDKISAYSKVTAAGSAGTANGADVAFGEEWPSYLCGILGLTYDAAKAKSGGIMVTREALKKAFATNAAETFTAEEQERILNAGFKDIPEGGEIGLPLLSTRLYKAMGVPSQTKWEDVDKSAYAVKTTTEVCADGKDCSKIKYPGTQIGKGWVTYFSRDMYNSEFARYFKDIPCEPTIPPPPTTTTEDCKPCADTTMEKDANGNCIKIVKEKETVTEPCKPCADPTMQKDANGNCIKEVEKKVIEYKTEYKTETKIEKRGLPWWATALIGGGAGVLGFLLGRKTGGSDKRYNDCFSDFGGGYQQQLPYCPPEPYCPPQPWYQDDYFQDCFGGGYGGGFGGKGGILCPPPQYDLWRGQAGLNNIATGKYNPFNITQADILPWNARVDRIAPGGNLYYTSARNTSQIIGTPVQRTSTGGRV